FFSSRRRHTRLQGDWSSDVCSSDLARPELREREQHPHLVRRARTAPRQHQPEGRPVAGSERSFGEAIHVSLSAGHYETCGAASCVMKVARRCAHNPNTAQKRLSEPKSNRERLNGCKTWKPRTKRDPTPSHFGVRVSACSAGPGRNGSGSPRAHSMNPAR